MIFPGRKLYPQRSRLAFTAHWKSSHWWCSQLSCWLDMCLSYLFKFQLLTLLPVCLEDSSWWLKCLSSWHSGGRLGGSLGSQLQPGAASAFTGNGEWTERSVFLFFQLHTNKWALNIAWSLRQHSPLHGHRTILWIMFKWMSMTSFQ